MHGVARDRNPYGEKAFVRKPARSFVHSGPPPHDRPMFLMAVPETHPSPPGTAAVPRREAWLEIIRGRARHRVRWLDTDTFLIGSAPDRHLVLADAAVPSLHSFIYRTKSRLVVCHLGAEPPLLINGYRTTRMALEAGDRMTVGPFELAVHLLPSCGSALRSSSASPHQGAPSDGRDQVALLRTDVISAMERARSALRLYPDPDRDDGAANAAVGSIECFAPQRRAASGNG